MDDSRNIPNLCDKEFLETKIMYNGFDFVRNSVRFNSYVVKIYYSL
jgi:hypothetical protein